MVICDICGTRARCAPRQIDTKKYDLCGRCRQELADKLGGGRAKGSAELSKAEEAEEYDEISIYQP